jgi:uncharacterized protein (AIM24 family)
MTHSKSHKLLSKGFFSRSRPNLKRSNRTKKTSSLVPKYKIENGPAFASVQMILNPGQTILSNEHKLGYMDSKIKVSKAASGGFWASLVRGLFTTETLLQTEYTGVAGSNNEITLSNNLPGDIKPLSILPGEKFVISSYGLICFTNNIKLETTFKWRNMIMGANPFLTCVVNNSTVPGMSWLSAYGGIKTLRLAANETIILSKGMFVACESSKDYNITITEYSDLAMKFTGPCVVYTQNRNIHEFVDFIKMQIMPEIDNKINNKINNMRK